MEIPGVVDTVQAPQDSLNLSLTSAGTTGDPGLLSDVRGGLTAPALGESLGEPEGSGMRPPSAMTSGGCSLGIDGLHGPLAAREGMHVPVEVEEDSKGKTGKSGKGRGSGVVPHPPYSFLARRADSSAAKGEWPLFEGIGDVPREGPYSAIRMESPRSGLRTQGGSESSEVQRAR